MYSFDSHVGQDAIKQYFRQVLTAQTLSHAYMFSGPPGTGKRDMARALAGALFCLQRDDDACGTCAACRKLQNGNHPALYMLEPDGSSIKIEQVRQLQRHFSYRGDENQWKMYVIRDAERMTVQAANSLLKFLEEPQQRILAVLITSNEQAILPTIRSRVQKISFIPLSALEMEQALRAEGCEPMLARSAAHLRAGIASARELLENDEFAEIRNVVIQLGREAMTGYGQASLLIQDKLVKSGLLSQIECILDLMVLWYKDMVLSLSGRLDQLVFADQSDLIGRQARQHPLTFWIAAMERVIETRKRLRFHANPQLALEQLLFQVQGG